MSILTFQCVSRLAQALTRWVHDCGAISTFFTDPPGSFSRDFHHPAEDAKTHIGYPLLAFYHQTQDWAKQRLLCADFGDIAAGECFYLYLILHIFLLWYSRCMSCLRREVMWTKWTTCQILSLSKIFWHLLFVYTNNSIPTDVCSTRCSQTTPTWKSPPRRKRC